MRAAIYILFLVLLCAGAGAQERVFIDFGSTNEDLASREYINNISSSYQAGYSNGVLLYNQQGISTGINLKVHDDWMNINPTGTTAPDFQLGISQRSSQDSFFGATGSFNGNTEPTGGFKLRQLDSSKYYSFSFFASRMNAADNRETTYTVSGSTNQNTSLNASNNTSQKVFIYNIQPNANGEITITATAGINNTNSSGFYYLNALEFQISNALISQFSTGTSLQLIYPITVATWEVGKTVPLLWKSEGIDTVTLEYSADGGNSFNLIATAPATDSSYNFTVPNQLSNNAIIKLSSSTQIIDSAPINVIPDDGTIYKIVILGSSTAAGSGPSNQYNAWAWKYTRFLEQLDTRYEVVNISQGGFVTYNILPTGTTIPTGVNKTIDVNKNITKAVSLGAHGVIINLPSNDAASSYPVADQVNNYSLITQIASQNHIQLWVTTPQPRNFGLNSNQAAIQNQMVTETYNSFGVNAVDFWTGIGNSTGNQILLPYNSGDGVHATNEAHQIFYERLLLKNIHSSIKNTVDGSLNLTQIEKPQISMYPNPTGSLLFIDTDANISNLKIYNQLGQLVLEKKSGYSMLNVEALESGFYTVHFQVENEIYYHRLLKK